VNTSPVRIKALQRARVPDFELAPREDSIAFGHFRLSAAQRFLDPKSSAKESCLRESGRISS